MVNTPMENDLRRWMRLVEADLTCDVLDTAAEIMRQRALATGLPHDTPEFRAKFVQWSKDAVAAIFRQLSQLFKGGTLPIWREIIAPVDWQPTERHPGIYWTWDRDAASAYGGDRRSGDGVPWLLSAEVTFDQIDWVETLAQNATPAYAEEKEIRLKRYAHVTLTRATCEKTGQELMLDEQRASETSLIAAIR